MNAASNLSQFAVVGMGVMGRSLALNLADRGTAVAVWNREADLLERAVSESGGRLRPAADWAALVGGLERPRRILLMVTAGAAVDGVLGALGPLLQSGDVVVDGGNSWYGDTVRREAELAARGVHFVGLGVSGGEEGARRGPSLMAGGSAEAYRALEPHLLAIAARTEAGPCAARVGRGGAGHFAKMVHNGLEYADMQVLAEAYQLLGPGGLGWDAPRLAEEFERWNRGPLASFLMEVSAEIFRTPDPSGPGWLLDQVLDRAAQKGTGRWTVEVALRLSVAVPAIAAALDARVMSSAFDLRQRLSASAAPRSPLVLDPADLEPALAAAKVAIYAQGIELLREGDRAEGFGLDLSELIRIWKGGCIIRSAFLDELRGALARGVRHLLEDVRLAETVRSGLDPWRRVVAAGVAAGLPLPCLGAALTYAESLCRGRLPQNLIQAQRDAFGAHGFERRDGPGVPHHASWRRPTGSTR